MTTLYVVLRNEIADALVNRNRSDLADRLDTLDDDAIHEAERLMVDAIEEQLDRPLTVGEFDTDEIRRALEGDSNDAEHDALVSVASTLGITYRDPDEEDEEDEEDERAASDRELRPYVVGRVACPGVIERFHSEQEASQYIADSFPAEEVAAGTYYIDGPADDTDGLAASRGQRPHLDNDGNELR